MEWFHNNYRVFILPSAGMQYNPDKKLAISDLYENYGIYAGGSSPRKKISLIFFTQIITDIVGKRDPSTSRGVYVNVGKSFLQGCNFYLTSLIYSKKVLDFNYLKNIFTKITKCRLKPTRN